jgi:hypothetical protein
LRRTESTDFWTKRSPFTVHRFPFPVDFLLFFAVLLPTRCPEAFPARLGKQGRQSCKTLPSRTAQLGSGVSALPSRPFYELVDSRDLCPASLRPLVPAFLGELVLLGRTQGEGDTDPRECRRVASTGDASRDCCPACRETYRGVLFCMGGFWRWCTRFKLNLAWLFLHGGRAHRQACC